MILKNIIKKPILFIAIVVSFFIGAFISVNNVPVQLWPEIMDSSVNISLYDSSKNIVEMKEEVKKVESSLSQLEEKVDIQSTISKNNALIKITYENNENLKEKESIVNDLLSNTVLDTTVEKEVFHFSNNTQPIYTLAVVNEDLSEEKYKEVTLELQEKFANLPYFSNVESSSSNSYSTTIKLDQDKMSKKDVSQENILTLLGSQESTGSLILNDKSLIVEKNVKSIEDLENLLVTENVRLKEVATFENVSNNELISTLNSKEIVSYYFYAKEGSRINDNIVEFEEYLSSLETDGAFNGLSHKVLANEGATIDDSLGSLLNLLIVGSILSVLVLFVFLRNVKAVLISAISIPLSFAISLVIFNQLDFTLNLMTLAALALAAGMLIDNTVVVVDSIFAKLQEGESRKEAMLKGVKFVVSPVFASTLTTIAIFVPLLFATGLMKRILFEFSMTLIISLFVSYLVSIVVIPPLIYWLFKEHKVKTVKPEYKRTLKVFDFIFKYKVLAFILSIGLSIGGIFLTFQKEFELTPTFNSNNVSITLIEDENYSKEEILKASKAMEEKFKDRKEVDFVVQEWNERNFTTLDIKFFMKDNQYVESFKEEIISHLKKNEPLLMSTLNTSDYSNLEHYVLELENNSETETVADIAKLEKALKGKILDFHSSNEDTETSYSLTFNDSELLKQNLEKESLLNVIQQNNREQFVGFMEFDTNEHYLFLDFGTKNLSVKELLDQQVTPDKKLKDFVTIQEVEYPSQLTTKNGVNKVQIILNYSNEKTIEEFDSELKEVISDLKLSEDTKVIYNEDIEEQSVSFMKMVWMLLASLLFIFVILANQFNSFKQPFIIMFSILFTFIGIALGLYVFDAKLTITAFTGVIMLGGIVVNNSILLIDVVNVKRKEGYSVENAFKEAIIVRIRPILMTTATTVLGVVPLIVGLSEDNFQRPLAIVLGFGLTVSTIFTIFLTPIVYQLFEFKPFKYVASKFKKK